MFSGFYDPNGDTRLQDCLGKGLLLWGEGLDGVFKPEPRRFHHHNWDLVVYYVVKHIYVGK